MIERIIVGTEHTNTFVVSVGKKECLLIDPGAEGKEIVHRLDIVNFRPVMIIFTHGHLDHVAATSAIIEHYEHHIEIGVHPEDAHFLGNGAYKEHKKVYDSLGVSEVDFEEAYRPIQEASFTFEDGDVIGESDLSVIHTPGHTPGSVCFYSEERNALFSGDTLLFKLVGTTQVPEGDQEQLFASIREKLFTLPPETRLFPGHGPLSSLEREIRNNPALR